MTAPATIVAHAISTWIPVSKQVLEDAVAMKSALDEMFRRAELASRGFLGLVRCARCRRTTRCIYALGDRLYGRTCYRIVA